jgi:hydroxymethylbilane synthase
VAQGAIAVEAREGDAGIHALLAALDHAPTRTCVRAERSMNRSLHGSCQLPVAASATLDGGILSLEGLVGSPKDGRLVRANAVGKSGDPEGLGRLVAAELRLAGAEEIINESQR